MPMPGCWPMSMAWMSMGAQSPAEHAVMFLVMWTVMMIAMMLPSVMPAVLLHQRLIDGRIKQRKPALYQLTRWKQLCLRHCRSPLQFFAQHDIRRPGDSWRFGIHHGAYCAACCWGLMAIQLALGVMSVPLMALVALVILLEKQWRHGETLARYVGIVTLGAGLIFVLRATIRP